MNTKYYYSKLFSCIHTFQDVSMSVEDSYLSAMKFAITSSSVADIQSQRQKHIQLLDRFESYVPCVELQKKSFKVDELSQALIPDKLVEHGYKAAQVRGDGNCLFNAMSLALCGDDSLATNLRCLTAAELYLNAAAYSSHPLYVETLASIPNADPEAIFASMISSIAVDIFYENDRDKVLAIKSEARDICANHKHCTLIGMLALSTVTGMKIVSVYPDMDLQLKTMFDSVIYPLSILQNAHSSKTVAILWSRDGNFDCRDGAPFTPNHFVMLVPSIYI